MTMPTPAPAAGLSWRPIAVGDVPAWHRLVRAIEDVDDPAERNTAEDLHDALLDGSWKDPVRDSILGVDDDGVARAFGHVEVRPGDVRVQRAFCWGGVDPSWRGRGIGRAVLDWQEQVGRAKIAAASTTAPGRLLVHLDDHVEPARRLLERAGFQRLRVFLELSRPLSGEPVTAPLDAGLRIAGYTPALGEQVRQAHNEAFADHWGSEPRSREDWDRTLGNRHFRPDWSFVVLDGEQVAGYAFSSAYQADWQPQGYTSGWTDILGVRRAWRRRGIASALLAATMGALRADGIERADLGVDVQNPSRALDLYTGLGYAESRRSFAYGKDV